MDSSKVCELLDAVNFKVPSEEIKHIRGEFFKSRKNPDRFIVFISTYIDSGYYYYYYAIDKKILSIIKCCTYLTWMHKEEKYKGKELSFSRENVLGFEPFGNYYLLLLVDLVGVGAITTSRIILNESFEEVGWLNNSYLNDGSLDEEIETISHTYEFYGDILIIDHCKKVLRTGQQEKKLEIDISYQCSNDTLICKEPNKLKQIEDFPGSW